MTKKSTLSVQIKNLEERLKRLENKDIPTQHQYDFSKFVSTNGNVIVIKGEKLLKSFTGVYAGQIEYGASNIEEYTKQPDYTICNLSDLKEGDVFITKENADKLKYRKCMFNVLMGKTDDYRYAYQYLINHDLAEIINYSVHSDTQVIKFLRD